MGLAVDQFSGTAGAVSRRGVLKMIGATAAAIPVVSALGACGGPSGGGGNGSGSGTLSLAYLGDATQQKAFNDLFTAFNKANPTIKIKADGVAAKDWASFANTISTRLAGGKSYDVIQVATEGQLLMASKNVLAPLDEFIARDKKLVDAYYAGIDPHLREWTEKYGSPDGKTYYIPGGYNSMVLYCNTELFASAGVELPEADWTWDEFKAAGKQLKERTGAYLTYPGDGVFPFGEIMPWLLTNDASTLDADWKKPTFNSSGAVEAATFVKGLYDAGIAPKPGGEFDAPGQYGQGKLATLGGGRWPTLDIRRLKLVAKTRILNWPTKRGKGSPIGWDGWPILKASANKDAAWTFLKWLMSKEASEFYASVGGTTVPALNSVAASQAFLENAPAGSQLLSEAIGYGTPIPSPIDGSGVQKVITAGWKNAITGLKPVREALNEANEQLKPLL